MKNSLLIIIFSFASVALFAMKENTYNYRVFFYPDDRFQLEEEQGKLANKYNLSYEINEINLKPLLSGNLHKQDIRQIVHFFILLGNKDLLLSSGVDYNARKKHRELYADYFEECDKLFYRSVGDIAGTIFELMQNKIFSEEEKLSNLLLYALGLRAIALVHCAQLLSCNKSYFLFAGKYFIPPTPEEDRSQALSKAKGNCAEATQLIEQFFPEMKPCLCDIFFTKTTNINHLFNVKILDDKILIVDGYSYLIKITTKNQLKEEFSDLQIPFYGRWFMLEKLPDDNKKNESKKPYKSLLQIGSPHHLLNKVLDEVNEQLLLQKTPIDRLNDLELARFFLYFYFHRIKILEAHFNKEIMSEHFGIKYKTQVLELKEEWDDEQVKLVITELARRFLKRKRNITRICVMVNSRFTDFLKVLEFARIIDCKLLDNGSSFTIIGIDQPTFKQRLWDESGTRAYYHVQALYHYRDMIHFMPTSK